MEEICRACLNNIEIGVSIFNLCERYNKSEKIEKMFSAISELEVKIGDGLPTQICYQCLKNLSNAYQFRIQCRESYDSLTENFLNFEKIYLIDSGSELRKEDEIDIISQQETDNHENNLLNAEDNPKIEEIYLKIDTDIFLPEVTSLNPIKIKETQDIGRVIRCAKKEQEVEMSKEVFNQEIISHDFPCYDCNSTFIHRKQLLLHIKKVHLPLSDNKIHCDICKRFFPSIRSLSTHLKAHSKKNEIELSGEKIKCSLCRRKFIHILLLRKHVEIFHKKALEFCDNQTGIICPICQINSATKAEYNRHRKSCLHRNSTLNCQFCHRKFTSKQSCIAHTRVAHYEKSNIFKNHKKFICHICKLRYISQVTLDQHLLLHKKRGEGENVPCPFCAKSFRTNNRVTRHIRSIHNKERRYKCELCDNRYFDGGRLKIHQLRHHLNEANFNCTFCDKSFFASCELNAHLITHTGEPKYKCEIEGCNKICSYLSQLKFHIRSSHTGERDFQCKDCDKNFITKQHLKQHSDRNHPETPRQRTHICTICQNGFYTKSDLTKHVKNVHKKDKTENL